VVRPGVPVDVLGSLIGGAEVATGPDGAGCASGPFLPQLDNGTSAAVAARMTTIRLQVLVMADLR
jgi:hypothetical protein